MEQGNFRINHKCPFCSSTYFYRYFWGLLRHVQNVHLVTNVGSFSEKSYKEKVKKLEKILLDYVSENPSVKWKEMDLDEHWLEKML